MGRCTKISMIVVTFSIFCLGFNNSAIAELSFGTPKANMEVSNLVPFEIVQKIATDESESRNGDRWLRARCFLPAMMTETW